MFHFGRLPRGLLGRSFDPGDAAARHEVLKQVGPLGATFERFWEHESSLRPIDGEELLDDFAACTDPSRGVADLLATLHRLSPGNGRVGYKQVLRLTDTLRGRIRAELARRQLRIRPRRHSDAFGSGGDFYKTGHATTYAAIVAAPATAICKTGTTNVTASHGSQEAIGTAGYRSRGFDPGQVEDLIDRFGFAYVSLSDLGYPYSDALRAARRDFWNEALGPLCARSIPGTPGWRDVLRDSGIPIDIFKVISPNLQILEPARHFTGVYHASLIPYVLAIFLHLGTVGAIVHSYDGIDELSNASSEPDPEASVGILIKVERDRVLFAEYSPECLHLRRTGLADISELESAEQESLTFREILEGREVGPRRDFLAINAGLLLTGDEDCETREDVVDLLGARIQWAQELIRSGIAGQNFRNLLDAL